MVCSTAEQVTGVHAIGQLLHHESEVGGHITPRQLCSHMLCCPSTTSHPSLPCAARATYAKASKQTLTAHCASCCCQWRLRQLLQPGRQPTQP
jgi:hypothetical protein